MYKPGGGGAQLLLISYVARLHGICNGALKRMKVGEGGTTSSLTALRLGISAPTPNFWVLYGTERNPNHSSVLSSATRLHEIWKPIISMPGSHSPQPCLCPPFLSAVTSRPGPGMLFTLVTFWSQSFERGSLFHYLLHCMLRNFLLSAIFTSKKYQQHGGSKQKAQWIEGNPLSLR